MADNALVLLVDDDEDSILLLQNALRRAEVANPKVVARDGQEAVDYLSASGIYAGKTVPGPR
jgi:two-component system response regulator